MRARDTFVRGDSAENVIVQRAMLTIHTYRRSRTLGSPYRRSRRDRKIPGEVGKRKLDAHVWLRLRNSLMWFRFATVTREFLRRIFVRGRRNSRWDTGTWHDFSARIQWNLVAAALCDRTVRDINTDAGNDVNYGVDWISLVAGCFALASSTLPGRLPGRPTTMRLIWRVQFVRRCTRSRNTR